MSDSIAGSLSLVLVALFNAVGLATVAYFQYRATATVKTALAAVTEVKEISLQTEKNTNSMKDALVEATRVAALLKGQQDERAAGDARREAEDKTKADALAEIQNKELDQHVADALMGQPE